MYRTLAERRELVIIPMTVANENSVKQMLGDVQNIHLETYRWSYQNLRMDAHAALLSKIGFDVIRLGYAGKNFFKDPTKRLDQNFYEQAGVDLSVRWDKFKVERNFEREKELFDILVPKCDKYIFLHDDPSRGFDIDLNRIPLGVQIVRPDPSKARGFTVFDYLSIIEKSWQIHCIESSFGALIESMQYDIPKFAHRYARPEAKSDPRQEFTYRSKWEILL
jgi:hypothetical protein